MQVELFLQQLTDKNVLKSALKKSVVAGLCQDTYYINTSNFKTKICTTFCTSNQSNKSNLRN
jgi:hypothetical protein